MLQVVLWVQKRCCALRFFSAFQLDKAMYMTLPTLVSSIFFILGAQLATRCGQPALGALEAHICFHDVLAHTGYRLRLHC